MLTRIITLNYEARAYVYAHAYAYAHFPVTCVYNHSDWIDRAGGFVLEEQQASRQLRAVLLRPCLGIGHARGARMTRNATAGAVATCLVLSARAFEHSKNRKCVL